MVVIEHIGGEAINISNIILRTGTPGVEYRPAETWTREFTDVTYRLLLNGDRIDGGERFNKDDRLTLAKTSGRLNYNETYQLRVRMEHLPSKRTILDRTVKIR